MRLRLRIICAGAIVAGILFVVVRPKAPRYQGKTIGQWLQLNQPYQSQWNRASVEEAVRHFGPAAVDETVRLLAVRDAKWKLKWNALVQRQSLVPLRLPSAYEQNRLGLYAIEVLPNEARAGLIPVLTEALNDDHRVEMAIFGLRRIGPKAVPVLMSALTNRNEDVRALAAQDLSAWPNEAQPAVPLLRRNLNDPSMRVRRLTARALARIAPPSNAAQMSR